MNQPVAPIEEPAMGSYSLDGLTPGDKKDSNRRPWVNIAPELKRRKTRSAGISPLCVGLRSEIAGFKRRSMGRDDTNGIRLKPTPRGNPGTSIPVRSTRGVTRSVNVMKGQS